MAVVKYPRDLDLVWIASDMQGYVAAFITAGQGPILTKALDEPMLIQGGLEDEANALPESSDFTASEENAKVASFVSLARRGLYVFDWSDVHKVRGLMTNMYEAMAVPQKPVTLADLPEKLREVATLVKLADCDFNTSAYVDVRLHGETIEFDLQR